MEYASVSKRAHAAQHGITRHAGCYYCLLTLCRPPCVVFTGVTGPAPQGDAF